MTEVASDRRARSRVWRGIFVGLAVSGGLAVYPELAPATYESEALVEVEPGGGALDALSASIALHAAALDAELLRRLAREAGQASSPSALARSASRIRASVDVLSTNGRSFVVACRDTSARRAQRLCDAVSRRAGEVMSARVASPAAPARLVSRPERSSLLWWGGGLAVLAGLLAALVPLPRRSPRPSATRPAEKQPEMRQGRAKALAKAASEQKVPVLRRVHAVEPPASVDRDPKRESILPRARGMTPAPIARVVDVGPARVVDVGHARVVDAGHARVVDAGHARVVDVGPARVFDDAPARSDEGRRTLLLGSAEAARVESSPAPSLRSVEAPREHRLVSYAELVEQGATITAHPVPVGWHPDSSLDVARLRPVAREVVSRVEGRCFVIAVTARERDRVGKSRTAAELALALSESAHRRVLLLEGNFGKPAIQRVMRLRIPNAHGFSRQLQAREDGRLYGGWKVVRCTPWLDVCAEGAVRSPGALLTAPFVSALGELIHHYGFVVIDAPTLKRTADCRALDDLVQGLVVVQSGDEDARDAHLATPFSAKHFSTVVHTSDS